MAPEAGWKTSTWTLRWTSRCWWIVGRASQRRKRLAASTTAMRPDTGDSSYGAFSTPPPLAALAPRPTSGATTATTVPAMTSHSPSPVISMNERPTW